MTLRGVIKQHDRIYDLILNNEGTFYEMTNPNPHLADEIYYNEVKRCICDMGFKAIKIHPFGHAVNPANRDGLKVFDIARELKVPVMVHTGSGIPFTLPSNLIKVAKAYPDVKIVIAHGGMMMLAGEIPYIVETFDNVFVELTWTPGFIVKEWADSFGAERLCYGSDHGDNAQTELTKIMTCGLIDSQIETILCKTAKDIFNI